MRRIDVVDLLVGLLIFGLALGLAVQAICWMAAL